MDYPSYHSKIEIWNSLKLRYMGNRTLTSYNPVYVNGNISVPIGNSIYLDSVPQINSMQNHVYPVTVVSLNPDIAKVQNNVKYDYRTYPKITAIKEGTAVLIAQYGQFVVGECRITVHKTIEVEKVELNNTSKELQVGQTLQLNATVSPSNATNKDITWTSSNKAVATVSNGKVTAIKAGSATITATSSNGKKATCKIVVKQPTVAVSSISLNYNNKELQVGQTLQLNATIYPTNATNKNITWTSSNKAVATVSNGKVTAINAGNATITATSSNGKKATCIIVVKKIEQEDLFSAIPAEDLFSSGDFSDDVKDLFTSGETQKPTSISLSTDTTYLNVNLKYLAVATVYPTTLKNEPVTYSSSNSSVVSIDKNGIMSAKKVGTATITARTSNGKTAKLTIRVGDDKSFREKAKLYNTVKLNYNNTSLRIGNKITLRAYYVDNSKATKYCYLTGISTNPNVAQVEDLGNGYPKVVAKQSGTTTIIAKWGPYVVGQCNITVR